MSEEGKYEISNDLLTSYFSGTASASQRKEIIEWANASPENHKLLTSLQIVWADTGKISQVKGREYDVDKAWHNVQAKKGIQKKSSDWLIWRVAAVIILMLGVGMVVHYFTQDPIQLNYTAATVGEQITLEDSSEIILNANSSIIYPEYFEKDIRKVKLQGEAFFDITPNPEKPFIIEAGPTSIQVLGTSFNIKTDSQIVNLVVVTGQVLFKSGEEELIVSAGNSARFENGIIIPFEKDQVDQSGITQFWRTRTLRFSGQTLAQVSNILEQAYEASITLDDAVKNCSLSVTFENDSLENILEIISLTLGVEVEYKGEEILITGSGCGDM